MSYHWKRCKQRVYLDDDSSSFFFGKFFYSPINEEFLHSSCNTEVPRYLVKKDNEGYYIESSSYCEDY